MSRNCSLDELRTLAAAELQKMEDEASTSSESEGGSCLLYWLGGDCGPRPVEPGASRRCRFFQRHGFALVPGFVGRSDCESMKREMERLVIERWRLHDGGDDDDGAGSGGGSSAWETFGTDARQNMSRSDYFLDSADKVHFFAEPAALVEEDDDGKGEGGASTTPRLRPEYGGDAVVKALNKAGHALHLEPGIFRDYTTSTQLLNLVLELGWRDPVVPQSMYIFKQAQIGGVVHSHQDSTFLYTAPYQSCLGLWLALDDATLTNGCLWVRPGSHREAVRRHYQRNPAHFEVPLGNVDKAVEKTAAVVDAPKFIMEELYEHDVVWDGKLPEGGIPGLLRSGFVPVECQAGDLLCFCGELDHLSLENGSDAARHTFQLHLVEGPSEGVEWDSRNWLQYPNGAPFLRLLL